MNSKYGGGFCGSSEVRPCLQIEKLSNAFEYATGILTVFHGPGVCQVIPALISGPTRACTSCLAVE